MLKPSPATRPSRLVSPKHRQLRFLLVPAELRALGVVTVSAGPHMLGAAAVGAGRDALGGTVRDVGHSENEAWSREELETGWETGDSSV